MISLCEEAKRNISVATSAVKSYLQALLKLIRHFTTFELVDALRMLLINLEKCDGRLEAQFRSLVVDVSFIIFAVECNEV